MDIKELIEKKRELDVQLDELRSLLGDMQQKPEKRLIGEYVIVRCRDAGVHAGILVDYEGREVVLKESRRLWYWKTKKGHSLSGVALNGIAEESKIAGELPEIILGDACEIIPATKESERSIRNAEVHNS